MLQIHQASDFKPYEDILNSLDISDDFIISIAEAVDKDKTIGYGIYYFNNDCVVISCVESYDDLYLYDGIVRSILFIANNNGINKALFAMEDLSVVRRLHFISASENCLKSIDKILSNCKSCRS